MKKLLLLPLITILFFLSSCSDGGGSSSSNPPPPPQNNLAGEWTLQQMIQGGEDVTSLIQSASYNYFPSGAVTSELYFYDPATGIEGYQLAVGEYSLSGTTANSKATVIHATGILEDQIGLYQNASSEISWISDTEVTSYAPSRFCVNSIPETYATSIKISSSLPAEPDNSIVGVWRADLITFDGMDVLTPSGWTEALAYFWPDGTYGADFFINGSLDTYDIGTYLIDNNILTISYTQSSDGLSYTESHQITELGTDQLNTTSFMNGGTFISQSSKKECYPLSMFWSKK